MNLVDILRKKIIVLEEDEHISGWQAILLHIETAIRHLARGQEGDETAFTDAIYRTNQAFEGSIKEAYRVLACQDPSKKRLYDIESYLDNKNIFRRRVLSQLTMYRTEYRNPSSHDHRLDFDESEAFLAIVYVSAFAILLLDQIIERFAFTHAQAEAESQKVKLATRLAKTMNANLLERVTNLLIQFCAIHSSSVSTSSRKLTESQVISGLHGFLFSAAPELNVETEALLNKKKHFRADLLVARGEERLVIELKRSRMMQGYVNAVAQVEQYLLISGITSGVLLFLPDSPSDMERLNLTVSDIDARIVILTPAGANLSNERQFLTSSRKLVP